MLSKPPVEKIVGHERHRARSRNPSKTTTNEERRYHQSAAEQRHDRPKDLKMTSTLIFTLFASPHLLAWRDKALT